jgi:hypothetical protein
LLFALGDLFDEVVSLLFPEFDVEVVVDDLDFDVGYLLDLHEVLDIVPVEEGYVDAFLACSAGSTRSVDVGFGLFGRRQLDDQFHIGDVQPSSCHVGSNENLPVSVSELLEIVLSGILRNVAMKNDDLLPIEIFHEAVGFCFGLCEDDRPVVRVVLLDQLQDQFVSFVLFYHHGVVFNRLGCPRFFILDHVDLFHVCEVLPSDRGHPVRHGG